VDGWRVNAPARLALASGDVRRSVSPSPAGEAAAIRVGGTVHVDVDGRSVPFELAPPPDVDRAARAAARHQGTGPVDLVAPMPGRVIAIHVPPGGRVEAGGPVVTLEAMKMEHAVVAPIDGVVADVTVIDGDQVERGQRLASVEP
jgi:biotin carboxyl carrier protein